MCVSNAEGVILPDGGLPEKGTLSRPVRGGGVYFMPSFLAMAAGMACLLMRMFIVL